MKYLVLNKGANDSPINSLLFRSSIRFEIIFIYKIDEESTIPAFYIPENAMLMNYPEQCN